MRAHMYCAADVHVAMGCRAAEVRLALLRRAVDEHGSLARLADCLLKPRSCDMLGIAEHLEHTSGLGAGGACNYTMLFWIGPPAAVDAMRRAMGGLRHSD